MQNRFRKRRLCVNLYGQFFLLKRLQNLIFHCNRENEAESNSFILESPVSLGKKEVEYISNLAAIEVKESEVDDVAAKLSNILDLFAQMQAADTDNVAPMAHPLDQVQRLREDVVTETDQHTKLQSVAPAVEQDMYLVPQVIE